MLFVTFLIPGFLFFFFFFITPLPAEPQECVIKPAVRPKRKTQRLLSGKTIKLDIAETQRGEAARSVCEHIVTDIVTQPGDDIPNGG